QLDAAAARPVWRVRAVLADRIRIHAGFLNVLGGVEGRARRTARRLVHVIVVEPTALAQQSTECGQRQLVGPIGPGAKLVHADEQDVRPSVAALRAHFAAAQARHGGADQRGSDAGRGPAQELGSRDLRIAHGFLEVRYGSIAVMFRFGTWPTGMRVTSRSALMSTTETL